MWIAEEAAATGPSTRSITPTTDAHEHLHVDGRTDGVTDLREIGRQRAEHREPGEIAVREPGQLRTESIS
jgi:hypothetical protein